LDLNKILGKINLFSIFEKIIRVYEWKQIIIFRVYFLFILTKLIYKKVVIKTNH